MTHIATAGNVSWAWRTLTAKGPEKKPIVRGTPAAEAAPAGKKGKKAPVKKAIAKKKK
jgi:hypothetical protein